MLYIKATARSPKVVIDFRQVLFEISGNSYIDEPLTFYQPIFQYITENFYEVHNSTYYRGAPKLTLHFYLEYVSAQNVLMLRQLDWMFYQIKEFSTYVYWYYDPNEEAEVALALDVQETFLNPVRLILYSRGSGS